MTTAFHARLHGRFLVTQNNFRRKKLHIKNQGSNFLRSSLSNKDNVRAPIQFRREKFFPQEQTHLFLHQYKFLDQSNEIS